MLTTTLFLTAALIFGYAFLHKRHPRLALVFGVLFLWCFVWYLVHIGQVRALTPPAPTPTISAPASHTPVPTPSTSAHG